MRGRKEGGREGGREGRREQKYFDSKARNESNGWEIDD